MRSLSAVLLASLLFAPSVAAAADNPLVRGIDPVESKLAVGLDPFLTNEGARTLPAGSYRLGLSLDYASGLMALQFGDEKTGNLIHRRLDLHLSGAYALTDWAEAAIDLPFTPYQANGFDLLREQTGFETKAPSSAGLGDLRALGKVRLLEESRHWVTASVLAEVRFPTGANGSFLGERGVVVHPRAAIERTFIEKLRVGFEGGYRYRALAGQFLNLYVGDELAFALSGAYELPELWERRWSVTGELVTATPAREPFSSSDALKTPIEALLGVKANVWGNFWLMLGGGTGIASESGFGRESFRLFASFAYQRTMKDRDADGVPDDDDLCPDVPGSRNARGCPDTDGDGVPDKDDRCVKEPGPAELDGCPDSDGDEIADVDDKCPKEKGPAKNNGCPAERPWVVYENGKLDLKEAIHFDTGKATIKPESFPILDELARVLTEHPEIKKVRIEGHTDNIGNAQFNKDLSQRRAQSVVDYLKAKGISPERLVAQGFGMDKPIESNTTPLGRAKNRRVEASILE